MRVAKALAAWRKPIHSKIMTLADPNVGMDEQKMCAAKAQFEQYRSEIVGFKGYTGYAGSPLDPGYEPFYRLALENNLPVLFHSGVPPDSNADWSDCMPLMFDTLAQNYPDLRIIMAHMGWPWHVEAALVVMRHPNVWVDLSGLYVGYSAALDAMLDKGELYTLADMTIVSNLKEALTMLNRYDRVLYASDFQDVCRLASYRRFIEALIPREHHEKVFRTNAEELFGITLNEQHLAGDGG